MTIRSLKFYLLTIIYLVSCGAPLKKADDVEPIFSNSEPLGLKVSNLCNVLSLNQQAPNLNGVDLGLEACTRAGLQAQNYSLNAPIEFASVRTDGQTFSSKEEGVANKDDTFLRYQTRAEVWLGKPLLNVLTSMLPKLNDKSQNIFGAGGKTNSATGKAEMNVKILGEPKFDAQTFHFSLQLYIESLRTQNGAADIRNTFQIDGRLFDEKYIAVTVVTTEDADIKRSLINKGKFVILMIPHAQDIYMDISLDLTFHSFGVDAAMKSQIQTIMGDAVKTIIQQVDAVGSQST